MIKQIFQRLLSSIAARINGQSFHLCQCKWYRAGSEEESSVFSATLITLFTLRKAFFTTKKLVS